MIQTIERSQDTNNGTSNSEVHIICICAPDVALCGADRTGVPERPYDPASITCVVCADLDHLPCPRCGA